MTTAIIVGLTLLVVAILALATSMRVLREYERGVAVCGSGQGICMAVNRVPGARGGVIRDLKDAEMTRRHNNANVACFGEAFTTEGDAVAALQVFLSTGFDGGRHEVRVEQLTMLEESRGQADV